MPTKKRETTMYVKRCPQCKVYTFSDSDSFHACANCFLELPDTCEYIIPKSTAKEVIKKLKPEEAIPQIDSKELVAGFTELPEKEKARFFSHEKDILAKTGNAGGPAVGESRPGGRSNGWSDCRRRYRSCSHGSIGVVYCYQP